MPVTKTAQRALRSSKKKRIVNKAIISRLEIAVRKAKKTKSVKDVITAISFADRATKKRVIHKNKAARIKSRLAKFLPQQKNTAKPTKGKVVKPKKASAKKK